MRHMEYIYINNILLQIRLFWVFSHIGDSWYANKTVVPLQSAEKSPTSVFTRLFINCVTSAVVICDKTLTKKKSHC